MSRKKNFSAVTLPNDKWLALFHGPPDYAKAVLDVIEEQVINQANHEHGPGEGVIIEVNEQLVELTVMCKTCGELLWQGNVVYPGLAAVNGTEVKH